MPVFSAVVSKATVVTATVVTAIVVTAIMAALWYGAVLRPAAQAANSPLLVTRLQQLAASSLGGPHSGLPRQLKGR